MPNMTPKEAWDELIAGNERFRSGELAHPHQDVARRDTLASGQDPFVTIFECSDSRVAPELIFDLGLGDTFTVRNAGQIVSDSALASIEFGVGVLNVPVLVVITHQSCGAVQAAIDATDPDSTPLPPNLAQLLKPIDPHVRSVAKQDGVAPQDADPARVGRAHLHGTVAALLERSEIISDAVANGTLAVVGAIYKLDEGRVVVKSAVGLQLAELSA